MTSPWNIERELAMRLQLEELNHQFSWLIDHERGRGVEALFTEDGRYSVGDDFEVVGPRSIADFYERVRAQVQKQARTSRHLVTSLHLVFIDETHATGTCLVTLYVADGVPPLPPPERPFLILDCADGYTLGADGVWRLESRTMPVIFGRWPWTNAGTLTGAP